MQTLGPDLDLVTTNSRSLQTLSPVSDLATTTFSPASDLATTTFSPDSDLATTTLSPDSDLPVVVDYYKALILTQT